MVAYNFRPQFAPLVESGAKRQTIRAPRKNGHARVGDKVHLYTGMRTKECRKIGEAHCWGSEAIWVTSAGVHRIGCVYSISSDMDWLDDFARRDGFHTFAEMAAWFKETHGLPFRGVLIEWGPLLVDGPKERR